jgi:O-antigen/teichoic acid export membrane protein
VDERSFQNPKLSGAVLISYKAAADLAGKGAVFVVTVAAARQLSPESFGIFSLGTTLGFILAVATDFGIQLHVARAIARRPGAAAPLVAAWWRVRVWLAGSAVVIVAAAAAASPSRATYAVPLTLFAASYACSALVEFLYYVYRGLSRTDIESSLTLWHRGAMLVCALVTLAWTRDVAALAAAMLLPAAATLLVSVRIARGLTATAASRDVLRYTQADTFTPRPGFPASRNTAVNGDSSCGDVPSCLAQMRDVWPIGAGIVLSALYFRIDVFLVQYWSGTEAVGLYNAVFRLVDALRLFPAAAIAVALPTLCLGTNLRPLARTAVPMTLAAGLAAIALWAAAGWLIPLVYGARYDAAVPAFRILLLSLPLMALNMALTHQLVGWNRQGAYAIVCALALGVNLALNARLIPLFSIDGAAWATLGTEVFLTGGCAVALGASLTGGSVSPAFAGDPEARRGVSASLESEGRAVTR